MNGGLKMGFGLILAGFILLFNPVIHVVDIIPDAIGFFMIAAGLSKTSCFVTKLSDARDAFLKLAFLEVIKFFSIVFVPYTSGSALVLMAFAFSVLELILFIPALNHLFEGISFAGLWYNGTAVYAKERIKSKSKKKAAVAPRELLTTTKNYILFFYIFRICATLVPELTELQMYDNLGDVKAIQRSLVSYKPFLYIIFGISTLILGIILIKKVSVYFGGIRRDKIFNDSLARKYESEMKERPTFFIARRMKTALFLFCLSIGTSLILTLDGVNILVGVISSALLIASAVIISKYDRSALIVLPIAAVRSILSIVTFILQFRYFDEYTVEAVEWVSKAYDMYYKMALVEAFEYIAALASVLMYIAALMKCIKKHLDMFGIKTENAQYSKKNRDLETYNIVGGKLLMCAILAIINYIMSGAYHYILISMSLITIINWVVAIVLISYVITTINTINNYVYNKELQIS